MKQHAMHLIKNPLIKGSAVVVFGNLFANFFNFLFNLFMSRSLSVSDYGILASVMSLIAFPALVSTALTPVVVRFAGTCFATGDYPLLRGLYVQIKRIVVLLSIVVFIVFLILIPQISQFFHISDTNILFMVDILIFFILISVINMAFLQAKLAFVFQVVVNLVNAVLRFAFGAILVLLGYSVAGATIAMIIAVITSYLISFTPLKFVFDKKIATPKIKSKDLFLYGMPAALTTLGLTSFISSDIILVKHFFNPDQAGLYAGLSLIGRVIFFVSAPIGTVMFPMIVQKHSKNENFTNTFKLSLLLVTLPSVILTAFYALFPKFSILFFLKKDEYFAISNLLAPFALLITLYSILSILVNFYLSIKKTNIYLPIIIGAILQIVLISLYHQSFYQIIMISFIIVLVLVSGFLLYYPYATKR